MSHPDIDLADVRAAVRAATDRLLALQREDGSWSLPVHMGPQVTALAHVVRARLRQTTPEEDAGVARWLLARQLPDGGFPSNPYREEGVLTATAACWGGLRAAGLPADHPAVARARAWVDAHGGLESLVANPMEDLMSSGPLLAFGGWMDPMLLQPLPSAYVLVPGAVELLEKVVNAGMVFAEQQQALLIESLQEGGLRGPITALRVRKVREMSVKFQAPNGSWNDTVPQTVLAIAALSAMGDEPGEGPLGKALSWLADRLIDDEDGLRYLPFGAEVWDTTLALRALHACGAWETPERAAVVRGTRWLAHANLNTMQPEVDNPGPEENRRGGFSFQVDNPIIPDSDDTGMAVGALGLFMEAWGRMSPLPGSPASAELELVDTVAREVERSRELALNFLTHFQNEDGGWAPYVKGMPRRAHGPLFLRQDIDLTQPKDALNELRRRVSEYGDPSEHGITARILEGYALNASGLELPVVQRGVDFLFDQQLGDGSWFGRWLVNYLGGTSWGVAALAAVGVDLHDPRLQQAVDFLLMHQNADGGWGDDIDSYFDPTRAGQANSMPALTGNVLIALMRVGLQDHPAVRHGVAWLLSTRLDDGGWPNEGWLHGFWAPLFFYHQPSSDVALPAAALGLYHQLVAGRSALFDPTALVDLNTPPTPRNRFGGWNPLGLEVARRRGDPDIDKLISEVVRDRSLREINALFVKLVTNETPGVWRDKDGIDGDLMGWLGDEVTRWTAEAEAHRDALEGAQRLFERVGWGVAFSLFCASLPRCYACANGARVLVGTQGLTLHTRRRILETAQFVFDVLVPGAFGPQGRGVVSPLKLRVMHSTVRHLTRMRPYWDVAAWGVPINQEDLAGTLCTFSVSILEGLEMLGTTLSDQEKRDWMTTWAFIGRMLGVEEALIPHDVEDGQKLFQRILHRQWAPSPQGKLLGQQLVASIDGYLAFPGGEKLASSLIRTMAGERCGDILGLEQPLPLERVLEGTAWLRRHSPRVGRALSPAPLLEPLALRLMEGVVHVQREGRDVQFTVPESLTSKWGVSG